MSSTSTPFGLSAALALPLRPGGEVDHDKLVDHARWCLDRGCSSVTVFGTTGEGPSLGIGERSRILEVLAASGLDMRQHVVAGVAASSVHAAAEQMRLALEADCRAVLVSPPFFFKGVSDDGVVAWFSEVFDALGNEARDVILYHIPAVTAVPLSLPAIRRLRDAYPHVIIGVKDSSGVADYARAVLAEHGDLIILIADERWLADGMRLGAQGSISGVANFCPEEMSELIATARANARIGDLVDEILARPVVPSVKALIARRLGDPSWSNVRAPLVPLDGESAERLYAAAPWLSGPRDTPA